MLASPFFEDVHHYTHLPLKKLSLPKEAERVIIQYRMLLRQARRFVIDDDMVALVAQACTRVDRLPLWIELARIPFDAIWVEYDNHARQQAARQFSRHVEPLDLTNVPKAVGTLFVRDKAAEARWVATTFMQDNDPERPHIIPDPVSYVLDPDGDEAHAPKRINGQPLLSMDFPALPARLEMATLGLHGGSANTISKPPWAEHRIAAITEPLTRARLRAIANPSEGIGTAKNTRIFQNAILESRGSMRFWITLLAAVNDVPVLYREVEPRGRSRQVFRHNVPYLAHTVISIKAPKTKPVDWQARKLDRAAGTRKRAHEVRGHWRVTINRKTKVPSGRVWIKPHQRGDAALGFVLHKYHVSASDEADLQTK